MDRKKLAIGIGIAVVALIVIVAVVVITMQRDPESLPEENQNGANQPEQSRTKLPLPANVTVPEAGFPAGDNVAIPEVVRPAAPGVSSKYREFQVSIEGGKFVPDTVAVYANDIAHITFSAVDRTYDVVQPDYGFSLQIPKGTSKLLEGQFSKTGKYLFYCASCGGPDAGPVGYIVVTPKQ